MDGTSRVRRRARRCLRRIACQWGGYAKGRSAGGVRTGSRRCRSSWRAGAPGVGARHRPDLGSPRGTCEETVSSQLRAATPAAGIDPATACAEIDLAAFRSNVVNLKAHAGVAAMVVVKADGYGHGILQCAREARAAGAEWLGVATPAEALRLREAGDSGPVLSWLYGLDEDLAPLVAADVDVSAQSVEQIGRLISAAATVQRRARIHLKIDTGLSRNGAPSYEWQQVCAVAAEAEHSGALEIAGIWSHLAAADEPGHPSVPLQIKAFQRAYEQARAAGLEPTLRHLANSAGSLVVPEARLDLVRIGIAAYGIDP